jgi:hypothetical protein
MAEHEEFWINPKYLTESIGDLMRTLCEIRNALILSGLAAGENNDRSAEAKIALDRLAVELKLLTPLKLSN